MKDESGFVDPIKQWPQFKQWFGNSKVVDESGNPKVVFHGTDKEFNEFTRGELGPHFGTAEQANKRLYSSIGKPRLGENIIPAYIRVNNPIRLSSDPGYFGRLSLLDQLVKDNAISAPESKELLDRMNESDKRFASTGSANERAERFKLIREYLKSKGYDGIVYPNEYEGTGESYIIFDPTQVKSAIGNSGAFDPKSGSLTDQRAPKLSDVKAKAAELKPTTAYKSVDQSQPFYLKSENLITEKMKGPMPAEDVHKMLLSNGVKPEEMKWTGLDEFLTSKGKQKVTPQEIQEHLAGNNLQVQEVTKGQKHIFPPKEVQDAAIARLDKAKQALMSDHTRSIMGTPEYDRIAKEYKDAESAMRTTVPGWGIAESGETTKFGSYALPGAEPGSYRELLVTMPQNRGNAARDARIAELVTERRKGIDNLQRLKSQLEESGYGPGTDSIVNEIREQSAQIAKAEKDAADLRRENHDVTFRSSHWDEPNPASHIRFDDRIGPNGEKILFIEEAQDDWAQKGRAQGYNLDPKKIANLQKEESTLRERLKDPVTDEEIADYFKPGRIVKSYGGTDKVLSFHPGDPNGTGWDRVWHVKVHAIDPKTGELDTYEHDRSHSTRPDASEVHPEIPARLEEIRKALYKPGVPDRPFKNTDDWTNLLMKRMVKYAVDHGYDAVAWAPGDVHFGRWGSQRFDWKKNGDHWEVAGTEQHGGNAGGVNIEEEAERQGYLQKGAAKVKTEADLRKIVKQVMSRESNDAQIDTQTKKIWNRMQSEPSGTSMPRKEGFEAYYDQIVPQAANKLGKQWGAKVGEVNLGGHKYSVKRSSDLSYKILDETGKDHSQGNFFETKEEAQYYADALQKEDKPSNVPYLPITPQMRAGVKSIPYSLFTIPLAAGALTLQQVKAQGDELQKKFKPTGVTK
jgi:hypothetical protein